MFHIIKDSEWIGLEPWLLFLLAQCYGCSWTQQIPPFPLDLSSTLWGRMWLEPTPLFLRLVANSSSSLPMLWLLVPPIDPPLLATQEFRRELLKMFCAMEGCVLDREGVSFSLPLDPASISEHDGHVRGVHFHKSIKYISCEAFVISLQKYMQIGLGIFFQLGLIYFLVVADGKDTTIFQSLCICIVMRRRPLCSKIS